MYTDKDSVIIDGISMGQYCTEAEFGYNKLWSDDSGRNLAGTQSGTLLGIFPKIVLHFKPLKLEEINIIAPILNKARQTVVYYDPDLNRKVTMTTYSGDWKNTNRNINRNEPFNCSFISVRKRV